MKASEAPFLKFLQVPKQFVIPIYQRTYSWTQAQCQQLWNDIVRVAESDAPSHFVGSIVYIEHGIYHTSTIHQLLVIDGQQRLTTLSLLVAAIARRLDEVAAAGEITSRRLRNYFLFNSDEDGELRYKLLLTRSDRETL